MSPKGISAFQMSQLVQTRIYLGVWEQSVPTSYLIDTRTKAVAQLS